MATRYPVVTLTGPRQSGKTTLCQSAFPQKPYVSLETPQVRADANTDPRGFLSDYPEGAVLDEVQRVPDLLSYIQVDVDQRKEAGRFILTGSANFALLQSITQSLAGRTAMLELLPLGLEELRRFETAPKGLLETLWSGAYPRVYDRGLPPTEWYELYVGTYIERDVRQILNVGDLSTFQTFLGLCAGRTGQLVNLSGLASDCGITHNTAKAWLSVLEASYLVTRLRVYRANVSSRLIKTPKMHFLDSGLCCYLLGIRSPEQLRNHPLRGAIFESWVVSEVIKARRHRGVPLDLFYFRSRKGLEIDLVLDLGDRLVAVEMKSGQTPSAEFFTSIDRFRRLIEPDKRIRKVDAIVVYGGDDELRRSKGLILPWGRVADHEWVVDHGA